MIAHDNFFAEIKSKIHFVHHFIYFLITAATNKEMLPSEFQEKVLIKSSFDSSNMLSFDSLIMT